MFGMMQQPTLELVDYCNMHLLQRWSKESIHQAAGARRSGSTFLWDQ